MTLPLLVSSHYPHTERAQAHPLEGHRICIGALCCGHSPAGGGEPAGHRVLGREIRRPHMARHHSRRPHVHPWRLPLLCSVLCFPRLWRLLLWWHSQLWWLRLIFHYYLFSTIVFMSFFSVLTVRVVDNAFSPFCGMLWFQLLKRDFSHSFDVQQVYYACIFKLSLFWS